MYMYMYLYKTVCIHTYGLSDATLELPLLKPKNSESNLAHVHEQSESTYSAYLEAAGHVYD